MRRILFLFFHSTDSVNDGTDSASPLFRLQKIKSHKHENCLARLNALLRSGLSVVIITPRRVGHDRHDAQRHEGVGEITVEETVPDSSTPATPPLATFKFDLVVCVYCAIAIATDGLVPSSCYINNPSFRQSRYRNENPGLCRRL
jgi:hypothetical protein